MFNLVKDISSISHDIIFKYTQNKEIAIDCTLGNGHDCDFLKDVFKRVVAFDIQEIAIENYKAKGYDNVELILDSHDKLDFYVNEKVDCIIYNLGYLPGGDKNVTTVSETTLNSIKQGLNLLKSGGIMTIAVYYGHYEGFLEKTCILNYLETLPKNKYGIMKLEYVNRDNNPPLLLIIEKK